MNTTGNNSWVASTETENISWTNAMVTTEMEPANSSWTNITDAPAVPIPALASRLFNYKVAINLCAYWTPIVIFVGLIGNYISFMIMFKPHNKRISFCNYMAALAISDNLMLLNALDDWTASFPSRPLSKIECKIMAWLFQAISFASMIFIFSMTVDRFLAIKFPLRVRTLCSAHRA